MSRQPLSASISRIPPPARTGSSLGTYNPSTSSALGKRGASDAGLDSSVSRRSMLPPSGAVGGRNPLSASVSSSSASGAGAVSALQHKLLAGERREARLEQENHELRSTIERLNGERNVLHEGEEWERKSGEEKEAAWATERVKLNAQLSELRTKYSTSSNTLQQLKTEHGLVNGKYLTLEQSYKGDMTILQNRIKEVESERNDLRNWQKRAEALSIELEEERRKAGLRRQEKDDESADRRGDELLRKELRRQSQQFSFTQQRIVAVETENAEMRQRQKESDAAARAHKDVERALKEDIRTLQEQLERARRDMDSLTQTFPSNSSPNESLSTLQSRLTALSALHTQATTDLATKDVEIRTLTTRLTEHAAKNYGALQEMMKRATEAERELRWAKEGRQSAERREEMARREVETLLSSTNEPADTASDVAGQAARVLQLEQLVASYKAELDEMARDSRDLEARLTEGAGLVKQTLLEEAEEKLSRMEKTIEALEATINELTTANTTLDAEVNDLMRRVASGEYNPATERCLEMSSNPSAKAHAVRAKQLEELRAENNALLDRLKEVDRSELKGGSMPDQDQDQGQGQALGLVPRQSFDRLKKDKEDMEAAHAKRLQRLKEIFGNKSKEFLEAVYSLLGWRIKFDESGSDIRLTSMYAPKGKMGLTLKFASQEGHFGTMQMMGGMARGLEESRHFWIVERQSVPGFLAQVTTEMFEKTTIGRAAGYVGLE